MANRDAKQKTSRHLFPWTGGKRLMAKQLLPLIPSHVCYVEAFAGAAAIFFRKEPSKVEVLNDVNDDIVTLYRVVRQHPDELARQFDHVLVSRTDFDRILKTDPSTLTDIQRAARFLYIQKYCFGGKSVSRVFGTSATRRTTLTAVEAQQIITTWSGRLASTTIENLDWLACCHKYDRTETFMFLDPPYFGTIGYGVAFELDQYHQLADFMRQMQGKALLTVNDCAPMRDAFDGLHIVGTEVLRTLNNSRQSDRRKAGELIVSNYDTSSL